MRANQYRIVFDGELVPDVPLETVKANLAQLFKSDVAQIERLFGNGTVNIKRDLGEAAAKRYMQALRQAGAQVRIEPEEEQQFSLSLVDHTPTHVDEAATQRMDCPKCGHSQPSAIQCESCGIVIEKYLARLATATKQVEIDTVAQPYAPPRAYVGDAQPEYSTLKPFGAQGRIGRLRYLAWSLVLMAVGFGLLLVASLTLAFSAVFGSVLLLAFAIGFIVVATQIGTQRLHDMGLSGWFMLLNLVPVIGTFFPFVLVLVPGNGGANKFGPPQPPNSLSVKILAALWLLVPVIGILVAAAIPAYQQYLHRAGL
jgi:uncharacterized membrane protein YhaH (DUF805 family)